jgi:hypothetical protein
MVRVASLLTAAASAAMLDSDVGSNASSLDQNRILCPVLAALYNSGALQTDDFGIAERAQIKAALKEGTWCSEDLAEFQSVGIADYAWDRKFDQTSRDRCLPGLTLSGSACAAKWLVTDGQGQDVQRFLNIFEMNGLETVEHGFSTGVRGGNCNGLHDPCDGKYPCEPLFEKFYASKAVNGRVYMDQIKEIICHAISEGDRGGEFAYFDGDVNVLGFDLASLPARQWQMKAAMMGWITAFGRTDESGEFYFTVDDMRAMLLEGRAPDGWERRRWGCLTSLGGCPTMPNGQRDTPFLDQVNAELPCEQTAEWWSGANGDMQTTSGQGCNKDGDCQNAHALCLSHRCTCAKGRNGMQMIFRDGECQEQPQRQYFGSPCRYTRADNPASPWTWQTVNTSSTMVV